MMRLFATTCALLLSTFLFAQTILVSNADELKKANSSAKPGETIVLKNGVWKDVVMKLNCSGTEKMPIVFRAQTAGKVIISGVSQLRLGGNYITVDGLLFNNGYSPSSAVIDFRINSDELANHCRVTNCVINNFNKPKRMSEDYWISFSGKNNRLDHCSFFNKKNLGVLLAVILDTEKSRENFHSIDHNYFGVRPPLASNGGEMIRVGVSEHCQFNSNTQIKDNFFESCDGETEIVSIKSCSNVVSNNVFKECQGSVVLRHGNYNTVTNNLFLGNGKEATGGVRIINRGQWVINNFFYKCRGESFRSPLAIMNGIPNSPANRYVQVTDAVVMNNTFVDCTPASLGEGSDAERTLPPQNVLFAKNVFYNNRDSVLYHAWDDIKGIRFAANDVSKTYSQDLDRGFEKTILKTEKANDFVFPVAKKETEKIGIDSLMEINKNRLPSVTATPGFSDLNLFKQILFNAYNNCGAKWFSFKKDIDQASKVNCKTPDEVYSQLKNQEHSLIINLSASNYVFNQSLVINQKIEFTSDPKNKISIGTTTALTSLFVIKGKGNLSLHNIDIDARELQSGALIASDTAGSSEHFTLGMKNISIENLTACSAIFQASKSTIADSIIIENCRFYNLNNGFLLKDEKDNKGYYNAEKIRINNNRFENGNGLLLSIYRGGSDESTLGPNLLFLSNSINNYNTMGNEAMIALTGVQKTKITGNNFTNSNASKILIEYKDIVRAFHFIGSNKTIHSGNIVKNEFVITTSAKPGDLK